MIHVRDLSIHTKLSVGFGFAFGLVIAIGLFGLVQIRQVNDATAEIRDGWLPRVERLGEIKRLVTQYGTLIDQGIQTTNFRYLVDIAHSARATKSTIDAAVHAFDAKASFPEERRLVAEFMLAWGNYGAVQRAAIEHLESGDIAQAVETMNTTALLAFEVANDRLDELVLFAKGESQSTAARAEAIYDRAWRLMVAIAMVGVLCVSGAVLWARRHLSAPIVRVTELMQRLSAGEVDVAIDSDARRDEIGTLTAAAAQYRDSLIRIQQVTRQAEAASRTKSQFLANMSHELRTPLNAVIGFSEMIKDARIGPLPATYQSYATDIYTSGVHLLSIINDVLDLSKIEAGRLELNEAEIALSSIARACNRLVVEAVGEKRIRLEFDIPGELYVRGDELRLKQVVLNLLSNAVKFTPPGGSVRVSAMRTDAGETVLTLADSGIGMAPEEIDVALEAFRRVDEAYVRRSEGTGLGLPLAKQLVELHGGELQLESTPGSGTTVRVVLPADRAVPATAGVDPVRAAG